MLTRSNHQGSRGDLEKLEVREVVLTRTRKTSPMRKKRNALEVGSFIARTANLLHLSERVGEGEAPDEGWEEEEVGNSGRRGLEG